MLSRGLPWSVLVAETTCWPPAPSLPGPVVRTHTQAPDGVTAMYGWSA